MKAKTTRPDYIYVTYIHMTPRKLWRALTDSALIPQYWLGRELDSTWKRGATLTARDADGDIEWQGKIVECRPLRRLAFTFQMPGRNQPLTRVSYDIEPQPRGSVLHGKGLKLTVTHHGFAPGSRQHDGISWGWPVILSGLKSLLETGRVLRK